MCWVAGLFHRRAICSSFLNSSHLAVRISSDSHCVYAVMDKVYGRPNAFAVYCIKNHSKCNFF